MCHGLLGFERLTVARLGIKYINLDSKRATVVRTKPTQTVTH
jgi:hypothetical protein